MFADDTFVTALAEDVLAEAGWQVGDEITTGEVDRYAARDDYGKVLHKAYDFLARRMHGRGELRQKLERKRYDPTLIDQVLDHLADLGYLNDEEFARTWVMTRGGSRGPRLLRQELRRKFLSDELIERVLIDHRAEHDVRREAETLARKRFERYRGESWTKIYPKLSGYLARRGYQAGDVRAILDELKREVSE